MSLTVETILTPYSEAPLPRTDLYVHYNFTEAENPDAALACQRIHAAGYKAAGFVTEDAIMPDGTLAPDLDKMRGPHIELSLAISPEDPDNSATMRKAHVPDGGSHRDLPSYKLTESSLWDDGKALLEQYEAQGVAVKDIGGLAGEGRRSAQAVHEVIRDNLHKAMGANEVWFFGIVTTTYDSLASSWGAENLVVLGEDTAFDDPRVKPGVALRPAMLIPDRFVDNLVQAYETAEDPRQAKQLMRSLTYYTEGLGPDQMSSHAYETVQQLRMPHPHQGDAA